MKNWIISLGTIIILSSLISMIMPEGKLGKFIKYYFSLIVMIVIIQPVINLKGSNFNSTLFYDENQIILQQDYLEYVAEKRINNYREECQNIAENLGVKGVFVDIEYEIVENGNFSINKVYLNFKNSVIISDKAHIDIIEEIKNSICNYLVIDESRVVIYE